MPSLDELFRASDELERTIQDQCDLLTLAEQYLSTEQCPSRQELTPVLRSIQEMSKSLAGFLEILNDVLNDSNERSKLELLNFPEAMPNYEILQNLMEPKAQLLRLENAFYHNQTPTSILWEQTWNLAIWYSEYRETIASLYYIVENHIKGYFTDKNWLWSWLKDFYDQHRIAALHSIAKRAKFLETASDNDIQTEEAAWWCEQIDSFPKVSAYYSVFIGFLSHCPNAKNPLVVERLKEFAQFENLDENEFVKGQQETIRNKAVSLLRS